MNGLLLVTCVILLAPGFHIAYSMVYHVAFLSRTSNLSEEQKVGELHYQGTHNTPNVTGEVDCRWEAEDSSNIKKLSPNGTCQGLIPSASGITESGVRVESSDDFILHVYQSDPTGTLADGYLAIPDMHLGRKYYVVTYCSLGGFCQFAVVGTAGKTRVNIVFPRHVSLANITCSGVPLPVNATPDEPITYLLNENQVLHIESTESRTDLSGTFIASDHEVAVFVGARDVPSASGEKAYMIEQIPPINKWGTDFVVAPNYLNDAGDIIKIVSKSEETTIHILGFSPFTISNKGESVEWRIDWEMHSSIHSSKPILIVQVMSLNLYNDTTILTGSPAMVLVPHVHQWTDSKVYSDCLEKAPNQSILTVSAETEKRNTLSPTSSISNSFGGWKTINGSDYSVLAVRTDAAETLEELSHAGVNRSLYAYCNGKSAVLLDANWDWENENYIPTAPVPGDRIDNDCDGQIDEDNCTEEDTIINFTSTQNAKTGETTFKSMNVRGAPPIRIKVASCDIVMVTLRTNNEPIISYTAHITPSLVMLQVCSPACREEDTIPNVGAACSDEQTYTIGWSPIDGNTKHAFKIESGENHTFEIPDLEIDYDVMFVTALSESADFVIELPEKDCGKITSGELPEKDCGKITSGDEADNFGLKFVVSVERNSFYVIFLTNSNNVSVYVDVLDVKNKSVQPNETLRIERKKLETPNTVSSASTYEIPNNNDVIIMATGEISVYVVHRIRPWKTFGHPVLPVDILGPNYHVYLDSDDSDDANCTSLAITENTESNLGPVPIVISKTMNNHDLGHQRLFTANRRVAMFCGGAYSMAQMPTPETLGRQHYIPRLDLDFMDAEAQIRLVATEDSTVVIIRGNYDHRDTVELTGNIYTRTVVNDTLYKISSTKPIQVHLKIQSEYGDSVVVIPPVEQYKSKHVFPGSMADMKFLHMGELRNAYRTVVYENGTTDTTVYSEIYSAEATVKELVYERKAFSLTVLQYGLILETKRFSKFIIPSDVMYNAINKVCKITPGKPGDGEDNDCDGLTDEEQCTEGIVPGEIDADIDGSLNEDCANGTTPSNLSAINLLLTSPPINCSAHKGFGPANIGGSDSSGDDNDDVTIDNGMQSEPMSPTIKQPNKATLVGSGPPYTPLANTGGSIPLPGTSMTTAAPGQTGTPTAPVETCTVDCVCPCGWASQPKNYSKEELKAVVEAIQEKLKVNKSTLSSTIRSKRSAKDYRTEAAAIGIVGVAFLAVMFGAVVLLDLTTIARDVRMLMENLRQVFPQ